MANQRFKGGISQAEEKLFEATSNGTEANCKQFTGTDRIIRGDLLAWLCTDPDASKSVTYHGISIVGAEIAGEVDLAFSKISFPLRLEQCVFEDKINLENSDVFSLELACSQAKRGVSLVGAIVRNDLACNGGQFFGANDEAAIDANGAHIKGFVFLRKDPDTDCEFCVDGGVDIATARIDKNLDCDGGHFIGHKATPALQAESAQIDGSLFLHHTFRAEGEVRLVGAKIGGDLDCHGSGFCNTDKPAINAASAKILGSAWLTKGTEGKSTFTAIGGVDFSNATIGGNFDCKGSHFLSNGQAIALNANLLKVMGSVSFVDDFMARGGVMFRRATIGGDLNCIGGTFIVSDQIRALDADGASIQGSAFFRKDLDASKGFTAEGGVDLTGATIGKDLDCTGGQFIGGGQFQALDVNGASIHGSAFFRKSPDTSKSFVAEGGVDLTRATIGGDLECSGGKFLSLPPLPAALNASATKIAGNVFLGEGMLSKGVVNFEYAEVSGAFDWLDVRATDKAKINLEFAKVATFSNDEDYFSSYRNVSLNGFTFDRFGGKKFPTADAQIAWLRLQGRNFSPQPYEQVAGVLRKMGLEEDARKVMIAKNEDRGQHLGRLWYYRRPWDWHGLWDWCWYNVLGKIIGYGYRPWRPFRISICVVLFGWWLFRRGHKRGLVTPTEERAYVTEHGWTRQLSESYPKFSAFVYSVETFVPLLKLGISDYWMPNANLSALTTGNRLRFPPKTGRGLRRYLWVHITLGWVLTTLWVGGLTGLVKT